jgi:hypothetical protein
VSHVLRLFRWAGLRFAETTVAVFDDPGETRRLTRGMALGLHLPNAGNRGYDFACRRNGGQIRADLARIRLHGPSFGFRYAVFHPPEREARGGVTDFFIRNLADTGLPLVLENIRGYSVRRFLRYYRLVKSELRDRLTGVCFDVPHAFLTDPDWKTFFRILAPEVRVVHLSNPRHGEDMHLPLDRQGPLRLDETMAFFRDAGYDGVIDFEILPPSVFGLTRLLGMVRWMKHRFDWGSDSSGSAVVGK